MDDPKAARPFMPGYGILGEDEGAGLLGWSCGWLGEIMFITGTTRGAGTPWKIWMFL